jgi:hypothetical protein
MPAAAFGNFHILLCARIFEGFFRRKFPYTGRKSEGKKTATTVVRGKRY